MVSGAHTLMCKTRDMLVGKPIVSGDEVEEFRAFNNVSCEVQQGNCVGIVGPNGAGKSTLLKIFSRITEPSCGTVSIRGAGGQLAGGRCRVSPRANRAREHFPEWRNSWNVGVGNQSEI
jgi:ABC-type polysaccharide/polyol phosphate transport system ATPase subunit